MNAQGLSKALCEVVGQLLIVTNILGSVKQQFDKGHINKIRARA